MPTRAWKTELESKRRPRFTPIVETVSRYPYSSASRLATLGPEVLLLARRFSCPSVDGFSAEAQTFGQETTTYSPVVRLGFSDPTECLVLSLSHMRRFLLCRASRPFADAECLQGADAGRDVLESCSSGTCYGQGEPRRDFRRLFGLSHATICLLYTSPSPRDS